jgi:hypothetical protein
LRPVAINEENESEGVPATGHALHLTTDWSLERLFPYDPMVTAAIRKLISMYPEGATLKSVADEILAGDLQLWLMLDGEDFKGIVLTEIKTVDATGYKAVLITGLAGEDGIELSSHIHQIETWAESIGADCVLPVGRVGWKKPLARFGYEIDRVIYRKDIARG